MAGVIDTNLLLHAVNDDADEHARAVAFLGQATASPDAWFFTEGILYEFLRVATHARVFPRPLRWRQALEFLEPLLGADRFRVLVAGDAHWTVLAEVLRELTHASGNLFFDVRTVALMREHGIRRIYTLDADFLQFRGIEVVNPLAPG
jgi:toxin-antitoxin system PIN domain toxin